MNISELRDVLKKAAALFGSAGAKTQQKALAEVDSLLAASRDGTVDEFVERTKAAMSQPPLDALDDEAILVQLYAIGLKRNEADSLMADLKTLSKEKLASVASRFTGMPAKSVATKPKALRAIEDKLKTRAYQEAKDRENAGVTPW